MRIHSVLALSAFSLLACSSGGVGSPKGFELPPIGDNGGAGVPALDPETPSAVGGDDQTTTQDSGTPKDTGGGTVDTGSGTDTGVTDVCNQPSKCSADPAPTSTAVSQCRSLINGTTCPTQYKALYQCYTDNRVCTSSNTTDATATQAACQTAQDALNACISG